MRARSGYHGSSVIASGDIALNRPVISFDRPLRVVAIGGGTGLSTLLRGLKQFVPMRDRRARNQEGAATLQPQGTVIGELAAVVTVTDDGGSSGRLREELNILPPGDIRNCMVALSEDEHLLSQLFRYRFHQGEIGRAHV